MLWAEKAGLYEPAGSIGLLSIIVVVFKESKTLFLVFRCGITALLKLDIVLGIQLDH